MPMSVILGINMIRKYLMAGLLFWIPVVVTVFTIRLLLDFISSVFRYVPHDFQPEVLLGVNIPGIEFLLIFLILFFSGLLVANFLGRRVILFGESLLSKIPLIRSVYSGVKQTLQVMASPSGQAFRKVVMVSFPQPGSWSVGLVTNISEENLYTIFVPTTPNPTSGYIVNVSKDKVHELSMSVDEALKYIISLGTITHPALVEEFKVMTEEKKK